jgi:hypothetical protein
MKCTAVWVVTPYISEKASLQPISAPFVCSWNLKLEAVCSSQTLVIPRTTKHHISEVDSSCEYVAKFGYFTPIVANYKVIEEGIN